MERGQLPPSPTFQRQRKSIMYHSITLYDSIPWLTFSEHSSLQGVLTSHPAHQQRKLSLPVDLEKLIKNTPRVAWGCKLL